MARTESTMVELARPAPGFELLSTENKMVYLQDFQDKPLLVMFICNHCPFVIHLAEALSRLAKDYASSDLKIVAINSNDAEAYPADSFEKMQLEKQQRGYVFDYLYDESQEVARAYGAVCTPDFFLFDKTHKLVYRGRFDASRPGNDIPVTGEDLRSAIDALLAGKSLVDIEQRPSMGCNIKWKS